ncbi:MAG: ATP-binding protein [Chloroflexota bacterium]
MALALATESGFEPRTPETLEETGLSEAMVGDLLIKRLFMGGPQTAGDLSDKVCIPFVICLKILSELRRLHLTHVTGSRGVGERHYIYVLTSDGEHRARSAFDRNMYDGPAPVTLQDYITSVHDQSVRDVVITRRNIEAAFSDLVLHQDIMNAIGPAVNAGQSLFFYGAAGNGKSALATRITRAMGDDVYVPYAIEAEGSIIEFYDPVSHVRSGEQDSSLDPRWIRVRRPTVVVGGELRMESLDLSYSASRRTYEAPYQMKANTGMFLIDDFGRQRMAPSELLNRWIVPLEMRVDFLKLETGRKLEVPFDELLVFSSNLDPGSLMDEAFLRRVKYKVAARDPDRDMFQQIFENACKSYAVPFDQDGFDYLVNQHYTACNRPFRGVHPRDLLDQLVSLAHYIEVPPRMTHDLLDAVVEMYFLQAG